MTNNKLCYDKEYFEINKQLADRIALSFYYRLAASFVKSGKVLDYGCGTGYLIKRFRKGFEACAYDVSPYALEATKSVAGHVTVCSSAEVLRQHRFDLIVSIHVLEHVEDPREVLKFFSEILDTNGVLLFVVPNAAGLGHRLKKNKWFAYGDPSHVSLYPAATWTAWTESAGLHILKSGTDGLWNVPYLRHVPLWIQKLIFYPLPALQVATGRLFLPSDWGESLIVVARKKGS